MQFGQYDGEVSTVNINSKLKLIYINKQNISVKITYISEVNNLVIVGSDLSLSSFRFKSMSVDHLLR